MTATTHSSGKAEQAVFKVSAAAFAVPVGLFAVALLVRLAAVALVPFPMTEGSAYYTAVAENLASGRGLVIDAIWSYATPPLTLPRPAFELWQPLASFIAALAMTLFGANFDAAQLAFAVMGALIAPLTWFVARDAARRLSIGEQRVRSLTFGAGAVAIISGPLLLATVAPDSTLPFTLLCVLACLLMPAALGGERSALIGLGVIAGLAYLTRMEGLYLGVTFVALGLIARLGWRQVFGRGAIVAAIAAVVVLPWWLRNLVTFGSAVPGQIADNLFLTRNEQIFAYTDQPTLQGFLDQGAATLLVNIAHAFRHDLVNVLWIPSVAVVTVALISIMLGRRRAGALNNSPLVALLILGSFTLLVTSVLFPVATLWGTFEHAAGPLLVALIVVAAVGADAFVARVRAWRNWPRSNAWLAPATLVALTVPLTLLQITAGAANARAEQGRFAELAASVPQILSAAGVQPETPVISDRPVWLSEALGRPAIALPDEPTDAVLRLARDFGAQAVVVVEQRGRHPGALARASACFAEVPSVLRPGEAAAQAGGASSQVGRARIFVIEEACR